MYTDAIMVAEANAEADKRGTLSDEEYAKLQELTRAMTEDAPEPTETEAALGRAFIGRGDTDVGNTQIVTDEGETVTFDGKMTQAGRRVNLSEGVYTLDEYPKDPRSGKHKHVVTTLTHGYQIHNHKLSKVGTRNPSLVGVWYWNDNDDVKDFQRDNPQSLSNAASHTPTGAPAAAGGDDLDERLRRAEAALAAARLGAAAPGNISETLGNAELTKTADGTYIKFKRGNFTRDIATGVKYRLTENGRIRNIIFDTPDKKTFRYIDAIPRPAPGTPPAAPTAPAQPQAPQTPPVVEDEDAKAHRLELERIRRAKELAIEKRQHADAEKAHALAQKALADATAVPVVPTAPAAPHRVSELERWRDTGNPKDQFERERSLNKALKLRDFAAMGDAQKKNHVERLHAVSQKWRSIPLWKKVGISAGFLSASILASAFAPGLVAATAWGVFGWRTVGATMTGVGAGLGARGYAMKRNYEQKTANRAGTAAGVTTGILSFFGGQWLANTSFGHWVSDYFRWGTGTGTRLTGARVDTPPAAPPSTRVVPLEPAPRGIAPVPDGVTGGRVGTPTPDASPIPPTPRVVNPSAPTEVVPTAPPVDAPPARVLSKVLDHAAVQIGNEDYWSRGMTGFLEHEFSGTGGIFSQFHLSDTGQAQLALAMDRAATIDGRVLAELYGIKDASDAVANQYLTDMIGKKGMIFDAGKILHAEVFRSDNFMSHFRRIIETSPDFRVLHGDLRTSGGSLDTLVNAIKQHFTK